MPRSLTLFWLAWLSPAVLAGEPDLMVKSETIAAPSELAEPVREALGKQTYTVVGKDGDRLTLWLRSNIPAKANAQQIKNGLTYREIPEGTLIGAVKFPATFVDFRKQEIPAGVYTLRLAVQPETGDHMGTAPYADFVLLTQAENDLTTEGVEPKALYKVSAKITGGDHPAVMVLFPSKAKTAVPTLVKKADKVSVLETMLALDAEGGKATLGFAITVEGHTKAK